MDSYGLCLEIIGFTDSFNFEKKMHPHSSFFLMYSDLEVQKLKVFGFGEISTSAKNRFEQRFGNKIFYIESSCFASLLRVMLVYDPYYLELDSPLTYLMSTFDILGDCWIERR